MQGRTRVAGWDDAHSVAAVEALAHEKGLGVEQPDRVVAAQHLQGAGRHRVLRAIPAQRAPCTATAGLAAPPALLALALPQRAWCRASTEKAVALPPHVALIIRMVELKKAIRSAHVSGWGGGPARTQELGGVAPCWRDGRRWRHQTQPAIAAAAWGVGSSRAGQGKQRRRRTHAWAPQWWLARRCLRQLAGAGRLPLGMKRGSMKHDLHGMRMQGSCKQRAPGAWKQCCRRQPCLRSGHVQQAQVRRRRRGRAAGASGAPPTICWVMPAA